MFGKKRGKNGKWGAAGPRRSGRSATSPPVRQISWASDIAEHRTGEGKLYLCAIRDALSNRNVGYSIDFRMKSRLATRGRSAVVRRGEVAGCVVHSDRGRNSGQRDSRRH